MKPLSLTKRILAHDHLPEASPPAVAVLSFLGIIKEILFFGSNRSLAGFHFHFLSLQQLLLRLVLKLVLQLLVQHLLVLQYLCVKLLSDLFLLLTVPVYLFLLSDDRLIFRSHRNWQLGNFFFFEILNLNEEAGLLGY